VEQLTAQTAIAAQQLVAHQRRADSAEALIQQQAIELTQAQERLSHTVAELQVHQEEAKRQQFQVETLTEQLAQSQIQLKALSGQLAQSQAQLAQREAELGDLRQLAAEENQVLAAQVSQDPAQVSHLKKQVEELNHRLQRQQRYALQYKAALEQCLAQPDFHPSPDVSQVLARLIGKNTTDFQPWASVGDILAAFPQSPAISLSHRATEGISPPAPTPASAPLASAQSQPSQPGRSPSQPVPTVSKNRERRPLGPDTLSFAVRESPKPPARSVELPKFLPRATPVSQ
jgi:hypothetical protein